jgi:small subunit ribosomal protein S20
MPNIKSAEKRWKQSLKRREKNRAVKSELRTRIRHIRAAIAESNVEAGATEFRELTKKLDKAAAGNVIHANRAARLKSRISAALKAAKPKK